MWCSLGSVYTLQTPIFHLQHLKGRSSRQDQKSNLPRSLAGPGPQARNLGVFIPPCFIHQRPSWTALLDLHLSVPISTTRKPSSATRTLCFLNGHPMDWLCSIFSTLQAVTFPKLPCVRGIPPSLKLSQLAMAVTMNDIVGLMSRILNSFPPQFHFSALSPFHMPSHHTAFLHSQLRLLETFGHTASSVEAPSLTCWTNPLCLLGILRASCLFPSWHLPQSINVHSSDF